MTSKYCRQDEFLLSTVLRGRFLKFSFRVGHFRQNLSHPPCLIRVMSWSRATSDEIDRGFDHLGGLTSASHAEICRLIREVDIRQSWMSDGARTLIDWVAARMNVRHDTARQLVSVARRLADLPELSQSFARGDFSLDQVDAISKMATPETEKGLIDEALGLSNTALDRRARRSNPPSVADERSVHDRRALYLQWNLDESELKFRGNMGGLQGEIFQGAVETGADKIPINPETGMFDAYPSRLVDGLVELSATVGDTSTPPQLTVHAELDALTTTSDAVNELPHGALVPNQTAQRLGCDSVVETVIHDGPQVVGIGRNGRIIPGWLRRVVHDRDPVCQFPGCQNSRWIQIHHIHHWAQGGTTDLDNLISLCGHHHRFVHEHGWHITGDPNDQVVFRRPDWTQYPPKRVGVDGRLIQMARSM